VSKQRHFDERSGNSPQRAFGAVLRQLRLEKGYSHAHLTGYHRNYVGQLERGEKSPSLKALFDFAGSFELNPSDVLKKVESVLRVTEAHVANIVGQTRS
jgi:transcriptional regulator with XRE-family HTH domain